MAGFALKRFIKSTTQKSKTYSNSNLQKGRYTNPVTIPDSLEITPPILEIPNTSMHTHEEAKPIDRIQKSSPSISIYGVAIVTGMLFATQNETLIKTISFSISIIGTLFVQENIRKHSKNNKKNEEQNLSSINWFGNCDRKNSSLDAALLKNNQTFK